MFSRWCAFFFHVVSGFRPVTDWRKKPIFPSGGKGNNFLCQNIFCRGNSIPLPSKSESAWNCVRLAKEKKGIKEKGRKSDSKLKRITWEKERKMEYWNWKNIWNISLRFSFQRFIVCWKKERKKGKKIWPSSFFRWKQDLSRIPRTKKLGPTYWQTSVWDLGVKDFFSAKTHSVGFVNLKRRIFLIHITSEIFQEMHL